jgi:subtilisin family serine protease
MSFLTIFVLISPIVPVISASGSEIATSELFRGKVDYGTQPNLVAHYADVTHFGTPVESYGTQPYWVDLVDREKVHATGENVYVAVLDTGLLSDWPFFFSEANIAADLGIGFTHQIYEYDVDAGLLDVGPLEVVPFETGYASGHGTHVVSTITGYNLNGEWIQGIAPDVTIIPVRVLDGWIIPGTDGNYYGFTGGFNDMIAAGIYYVADLANTLDGPVIINMSLGGGYSSLIEDAVDYAIAAGVIIVTSAGNEGEAGLSYPGALPQVISVGALGWTAMFAQDDLWRADVPEKLYKDDVLGNDYQVYLEDFSSRPNLDIGQTADLLDVSAPGAWIVGPYKPEFTNDVSYYYLSGTSMASPHVAGIAALIMQYFPFFDQSDMETIMTLAAGGTFLNKLRGLPQSGTDVIVAFAFSADGYYTANWEADDFGAGFLQADDALIVATLYALFG